MIPIPTSPVEEVAYIAGRAREQRICQDEQARRGVVHTPPELSRAVLGYVDRVSQEGLGLQGLHDPRLSVVDPAVGTGVFLASAWAIVRARGGVLPDLRGLDIDASAVEVARGVLGQAPVRLDVVDALGRDAPLGNALRPYVAIVGNPPWSAKGTTLGAATAALSDAWLEDFKRDADGVRLRERKLGVLSDQYVRFIRWGAQQVRQAERGGVLALVTNGSYLDGPVHRAMRASLLGWFDGLEIVDLGGSALVAKSEHRDENVFSVRPSVAVLIAWRRTPKGHAAATRPTVRYARLAGSRNEKLQRLHDPPFASLRPSGPLHLFIPSPSSPLERYPSLDIVIPFHREGVQTNRDRVLVDEDPVRLRARMVAFARGRKDSVLQPLYSESRHYRPEAAREAVARAIEAGELVIERLAYRPFEDRFFVDHPAVCHRPRAPLAQAMAHAHFALVSVRKDRGEAPFRHAFAVDARVDSSFLSSRSSCRSRAFPTHGPDGQWNYNPAAISPCMRDAVAERPLALFEYLLAMLVAPSYGDAVVGALRLDYPRVVIVDERERFDALSAVGRDLLKVMTQRRATVEGRCEKDDAHVWVGHRRLGGPPSRGLGRLAAEADALIAPLLRISSV